MNGLGNNALLKRWKIVYGPFAMLHEFEVDFFFLWMKLFKPLLSHSSKIYIERGI